MAIIHCGFVPHQSKVQIKRLDFGGIILRMIPQRNHSRDRQTVSKPRIFQDDFLS